MVLTRYLILTAVVIVELGCVANPKANNSSVDPERSATQHIQLAMRYIGSNKP